MYSKAKIALNEYLSQLESDEFTARSHLFGDGAVESFENKLKTFYGVKYALCVDSATNGLLYLALAVGLNKSEIITTPLSYGATVSGALWQNNRFHFADIDNTLNISPDAVKIILKENPHIKTLYAVDFAGIPHDMFSIKQICDEFGIWYFADAAQSLGAEINGLKASSLADAFVVSFSPGKIVFCGEGACVLTNNNDLYKRLITITQHPYRMKKEIGINEYTELGLNGRMNPLSAIMGNAVFDNAICQLKLKQKEAMAMYAQIDTFQSVLPFKFDEKKLPSFYYMPVLVEDEQSFIKELAKCNANLQKHCHFQKEDFRLLPEQMKCIGKKRAIKTHPTSKTFDIMDKLYLLNFKERSKK